VSDEVIPIAEQVDAKPVENVTPPDHHDEAAKEVARICLAK